MKNESALCRWAEELVASLQRDVNQAKAGVCEKPHSANCVHKARKAAAELEAALLDLASVVEDAPRLRRRIEVLRRAAGKVRDADVLLKLLNEFREGRGAAQQLEVSVACKKLRSRRKRGLRKFLKESNGKSKPAPAHVIPLSPTMSISQAIREILTIRYAEALALSPGLATDDDEALHQFRLACKRLHYALDRFGGQELGLARASTLLDSMTKALGKAHDCGVLARHCREWGATSIAHWALRKRKPTVRAARSEWRQAMRKRGALAPLTAYTSLLKPGAAA